MYNYTVYISDKLYVDIVADVYIIDSENRLVNFHKYTLTDNVIYENRTVATFNLDNIYGIAITIEVNNNNE